MQVRDVMTEATITETPTDKLRTAAERMWREQTGCCSSPPTGEIDIEHEFDQLVRKRRLARIERGDQA